MKKYIEIIIISLAIVVAVGVVSFVFIHNSYKAEVTIDNQIQKISKEECADLCVANLENDAPDTQYYMVKLLVENFGEYDVCDINLNIITSTKVSAIYADSFCPYYVKAGGKDTIAFFLRAGSDVNEKEILEILSESQQVTLALGDPYEDLNYKKIKSVETKSAFIEDTGELQYPHFSFNG